MILRIAVKEFGDDSDDEFASSASGDSTSVVLGVSDLRGDPISLTIPNFDSVCSWFELFSTPLREIFTFTEELSDLLSSCALVKVCSNELGLDSKIDECDVGGVKLASDLVLAGAFLFPKPTSDPLLNLRERRLINRAGDDKILLEVLEVVDDGDDGSDLSSPFTGCK